MLVWLRKTWVAACASLFALAPALADTRSARELQAAKAVAQRLADEFSGLCPVADPGSQKAFDACRQGLFAASEIRRQLPDFVLWGRQRDPKAVLKEQKLTQFGPDVLTGMYLSLFMFNGQHAVDWVESEGMYLIRLRTAFRNRLTPGSFPYPFWHEAEKWSMYENANEILFWWEPRPARLKTVQFTIHGAKPPLVASTPVVQAKFDGKWLWTDGAGKTQPAVSLFDGLFSRDNPHLGALETSYRTFALKLRDGQCDKCHVPNNPDGMKKLVLLQTPAHAAAEIRRVLDSVKKDKMPRDEFGIEDPLDAKTKAALLSEGTRFAEVVDAAKAWENSARVAAGAGTPTSR